MKKLKNIDIMNLFVQTFTAINGDFNLRNWTPLAMPGYASNTDSRPSSD